MIDLIGFAYSKFGHLLGTEVETLMPEFAAVALANYGSVLVRQQ
jgi:hypothetical protein